MSRFQYRATEKSGQTVEGQIHAASTRYALRQLERKGLQVDFIQLIPMVDQISESKTAEECQRLLQSRKDALDNARQWSAPLLALSEEIQSVQLSRGLKQIANRLLAANDIERLASDPVTAPVFPFVLNRIDQPADCADGWLQRLVKILQQRSRTYRAMLYPAVELLIIAIIFVFAAVWIVPTFGQMYEEFGLTLPPSTQLLLLLSSWIYPHFAYTLGFILVIVGAGWLWWMSNRRLEWFDRLFPFWSAGSGRQLRSMGVFTQNLAQLLELEYPLHHAMQLAATGSQRVALTKMTTQLCDAPQTVDSSQAIATPLIRLLPPTLVHLLSAGKFDTKAIHQLGRLYQDREVGRAEKLPVLISFALLLFAGLFTGFCVIALFMPLIRMITSLA